MSAVLEVKEIITRYGQSQVLHGVSLDVKQGEVVSLLGRNGVGKTTTFRSIMGLTPPRSGSIRLRGGELAGKKPYEIANLGIGYVPDDRRIFADLTAAANLELASEQMRKLDEASRIELGFPHEFYAQEFIKNFTTAGHYAAIIGA